MHLRHVATRLLGLLGEDSFRSLARSEYDGGLPDTVVADCHTVAEAT